MDLTADFKSFQDLVTSSLVDVTRSAGQVSNQDLSFHRSSSENFSRSLERQNAHLLRLTNKLLKAATKDTTIKSPSLQDQDDIDDNWRRVVDVVDHLLEKTDSALDEFSGVIKSHSPAQQDAGKASGRPVKGARGLQTWSRDSMQKPQTLFNVKPDNYASGSFKPLLNTKPHALVSLEQSIGDAEAGYKHPYAREIEAYSYPPSVHQVQPPIPFSPPDESKAVFVDTEEGVHEMLEELKTAKEIAIDTEHHDQHSYIGIMCLMQISTREKDWIIDTLKPWRQQLQILNEVFADPKILKVFQGASMDIIWLQRDLGLYIVGLFDTFFASTALNFPAKSLKYLLQRFANFEAQKQFQLADWRVRPLPQEQLDYARSDTHYLLNVYDNLRNMLLEASTPGENLIDYVLRESSKVALQVYTHPASDPETGRGPTGWLGLFNQRSVRFSNEQFAVFRAVHTWRDKKAREIDEGIQGLLPNRFIWQIAENMPTSPYSFHQCCRGGSNKPVMDNVVELVEVVKQAKIEGKTGRLMMDYLVPQNGDAQGSSTGFRRPRHLTWRKEETNLSGVAAVLQQLQPVKSGESVDGSLNYDGTIEDPVATRSESSALWGNVAAQNPQLPSEAVAALTALSAILPLPSTAIGTKGETDGELTGTPNPEPVIQNPSITNSISHAQNARPEIFTLNELSRSKKRKASESLQDKPPTIRTKSLNGTAASAPTSASTSASASSPNAHTSSPSPPSFEELDTAVEAKRAQKRQAKADKRARKEAEVAASIAAKEDIEPFDYANAASLLDAAGGDQPAAKLKEGGVKRMNPFAKAMDTTTGAKRNRMGKEIAGKSMTFKS